MLKAKADIKELRAQELDGRLVSIDDVSHALTSVAITIRNRLLAIPPRAAAPLAGQQDPDVSEAQPEALVHEALTELSEGEIEVVGARS